MTESIYARKNIILVVAILTVISLISTQVFFIVWINYNYTYGSGEIVIRKNQDFVNRYELPGSGTLNDPYLIADYNLETNKKYAIYIKGTSKYFLITNCTIKCTYNGIYVGDVAEDTARIENNMILAKSLSSEILINIYGTQKCHIISNSLSFYDHNTKIIGIRITYSHNSYISNNTCFKLFKGVFVIESDSVLIEFNYFEFGKYGIEIRYCNSSIIQFNVLNNNGFLGIWSYNNTNCVFHHNNYFYNAMDTFYDKQAFDHGTSIWYDLTTNEGNYWSDLSWDDGITYEIGGFGNNTDYYPLQFPVVI